MRESYKFTNIYDLARKFTCLTLIRREDTLELRASHCLF